MPEMTDGWIAGMKRLAIVPGTPAAKAIVREIRTLCDAPILPLDGDEEIRLPFGLFAYGRRVPTTGYIVVYTTTADRLILRTIRSG